MNLQGREIKLFAGNSNPKMAQDISEYLGIPLSKCDVGKFSDRKKGTLDLANFDYGSLFGTTFPMDKKQRIMTHASGSSHAMTLIAVDINNGKPVKWMVENSWGAASGYKGNLIMTDEWFNEYMFRLVVEKKYVPESLKAQLAQKPILLPAWDPMFMPEE